MKFISETDGRALAHRPVEQIEIKVELAPSLHLTLQKKSGLGGVFLSELRKRKASPRYDAYDRYFI